MKIVYVADEIILCGGILVPFEHCRELRKRGIDAFICANGRNEKLQKEFSDVPVKNINELANFNDYDIIIAVWWPQCDQLEQYKGKKYQLVQGNDTLGVGEDYKEKVIETRNRKNWELIAVSKYAGAWTGREYKLVPNGLSKEWFVDHKMERNVDVLIEGNDEPNKCIGETIELAKKISNNIAWLTREDNKKHDVKVFENPPREELPKIYQRAKIFVKLSESEGFCLPILEAMASGCAVITKDMGGNDFCQIPIETNGKEKAKEYTIEKTINKLLTITQ